MKIILGSSSPYRKILLQKLQLEFETCSPDIDEIQNADETPEQLVRRLSITKAEAVSVSFPDAMIISSDQVAVYDNKVIGKPGNHQNAVLQLRAFSGQSIQFITGLCLYNTQTRDYQYHQDSTLVRFRKLTDSQINDYLVKDQPYQCAGSFRSEGLGCALFKSIETSDPDALIGLPILKLVEMLAIQGIEVI